MDATAPTRPVAAPPIAENIPASLKAVHRWICWDYEFVGEKWTKVPKIAGPGNRNASTSAPSTWRSCDQAVEWCKIDKHDGIGFTFGTDEKTGLTYSGVDIDKCVNEVGEIDPGAWYRICSLPSYAEISPSEKGAHVLTLGKLPAGKKVHHKAGVELYCSGRYFTFTGRIIPGRPTEVRDCTKELAEMHASIFDQIPKGCRLSEREIAISVLKSLNPARADDYTEWLNIGMVLKSVAEDLLGEWEAWSRQSSKFTEGMCAKKWESMNGRGLTIGSLILWGKEDGWVFPVEKNPSILPLPAVASQNTYESNGVVHHPIVLDPNDPHMGDGLTDEPGAGAWRLKKIRGVPPLYQLQSPIWAKSPELASSDGCITLSLDELLSWQSIRKAAVAQADVYVPKDLRETPVWDNHGDFCLLRRLMGHLESVQAVVDKNATLSAAEFILEKAGENKAVLDDNRQAIRGKPVSRFEDGTIVFRVRALAGQAKTTHPGITFESILAAAEAYGSEYYPRVKDKQLGRFHRYTPQQVEFIQKLLIGDHADDG